MSTAQKRSRRLPPRSRRFRRGRAFSRQARACDVPLQALLEENMERLARLISEEHGKVFSDAVGELTCGSEVVEFACGIPHLQKG